MLNECLSDKLKILKPFKKSADMYNQNLEIHSCWSFKQYLKFDYRMRHIHYYFKSKMFISLLKCLRYSQSTGHIPQVRSACHCSTDKLTNHTDSLL